MYDYTARLQRVELSRRQNQSVCDAASRIGNPSTKGVQFYRGSSTSATYNETAPSGVTNVSGSTILIAAETIENFSCAMLAKYRNSSLTAGQGFCRCYIASETKLRNDEGLYAYDCISNPSRIKRMNIKNFGNGSFGDVAGTNIQLNNYATITASYDFDNQPEVWREMTCEVDQQPYDDDSVQSRYIYSLADDERGLQIANIRFQRRKQNHHVRRVRRYENHRKLRQTRRGDFMD